MIYLIIFFIILIMISSSNKRKKNSSNRKPNNYDSRKTSDKIITQESEKKQIAKDANKTIHSIDKTVINNQKLIVFDCETTALRPGSICQLSYLLLDRDNVKPKNFYFNVDYVEPGAVRVHGLSVEKLKVLSNRLKFCDHCEEIHKDFNSSEILIAHNFSFDIGFLNAEFSRAGYDCIMKDNFCTMKYFTNICKIDHYVYKYKYPKLEELAQFLEISKRSIKNKVKEYFHEEIINLHDARVDVVITYLCFIKGLEEGYIKAIKETPVKKVNAKNSIGATVHMAKQQQESKEVCVYYGDSVSIEDIDGYTHVIRIPDSPYNRHLMKDIERVLIGKRINEKFRFEDFSYKILGIDKQTESNNKSSSMQKNNDLERENMLSLEEKRAILNSFEELREKQDKFGRYFYYFDNSSTQKKIVAREFTASGNGYVFGKYLPEYKEVLYKDGSVCVKDFSAEELKEIVGKSINSLR